MLKYILGYFVLISLFSVVACVVDKKNKKEKDDFKSADLAFKYLLCEYGVSVDIAADIIRRINQKYYYDLKDEKSKLIDIYKSSNIINKIENEMALYHISV